MTVSLRSTLSHELKDMILRHLEEISQYIRLTDLPEHQVPGDILTRLERLIEICEYPAQEASLALFQEAVECQDDVELFLSRMNQEIDPFFTETCIGQIREKASAWCKAAGQRYTMTLAEVWEFIAPIKPDHLNDLGYGLYEARWWNPVPMMDIELLQYTDHVQVQGSPYEPRNLPGGLAVRFSLKPGARLLPRHE